MKKGNPTFDTTGTADLTVPDRMGLSAMSSGQADAL
jgi:hypothetical protein